MVEALLETLHVGARVQRAGFFTKLNLLGDLRDGIELERRVGYARGRLRLGWYLLVLDGDPPAPNEFEFAGYSYFSGGRIRGHKTDPTQRGPRVEDSLRSDLVDLDVLRKRASTSFHTNGPYRVAKIVPRIRDCDEPDVAIKKGQYWNQDLNPIAQWILTAPRCFLVDREFRGS